MPPLNDERNVRRLPVAPGPSEPEKSEYCDGYDWRGVVLFALILAFAGFTMWLYH
jgi:hypothetical protein